MKWNKEEQKMHHWILTIQFQSLKINMEMQNTQHNSHWKTTIKQPYTNEK